jgi:lipopolysaccharide transport system ATP-binding protein
MGNWSQSSNGIVFHRSEFYKNERKCTLTPIFSRVTTQSSGQIKVTQADWEAARETTEGRPQGESRSWEGRERLAVRQLRRRSRLGNLRIKRRGKARINTTLLKMLNGLIKPDAGSITMRGRVGALIALGAGFNPILTGRENIYINGSVLGLTKKEIDEKIDEIIDFAEIREFIDMPVQSYSSGMTVRLGFAVATAMDPDVLILDEVLAVGDVNFRLKCYQRISKIRAKSAIIFVSHNTDQLIHVCSRGVVINAGRIMAVENIEKAIAYYGELTKTILNGASSIVQDEMKNLRIDCPQRFSFGEKLPIQIEYFSEKKRSI